jgi:hypothetical protein
MKIGAYVLTVTEDCPIAGWKLPLVRDLAWQGR